MTIMRLDIWGTLANGGQASATNTQIANYLLTTVNKAAPDAATLAAAVNAINTETGAAQGNFLSTLAAHTANQTQVGLIGLATKNLSVNKIQCLSMRDDRVRRKHGQTESMGSHR